MPIPAQTRIDHYNAKWDAEAVETRFTEQKEAAIDGFATACASAEAVERQIQTVLNKSDVLTPDRCKYHNFGRQCAKLIRNGVADPALTTQVTLFVEKYVAWGCVEATLISIALNVFSVTVPPA